MDDELELNTIRCNILILAKDDIDINDLQLAEITRYVLSIKFFWKYFNLLKKTVNPDEVFNILHDLAYSIATPKQNLN